MFYFLKFLIIVLLKLLGDPKKYKLDEIKPKKQVKINANDNLNKKSEFIKKNREDFRRSIVDIIM